jgi:hypothetical protein
MCLGGFLQLKPTAGCQISNLTFEKNIVEGDLYKYPVKKYIMDGKVFPHLGPKSTVLPGLLTDLSSWVGFCTSRPQLGVKYQL